jgi:hypothetical protein
VGVGASWIEVGASGILVGVPLHKMKLSRVVRWSALVGLLIPLALWGRYLLFGTLYRRWVMFVWPSSLVLMATDGREGTWFARWVLLLAMTLNVMAYAVVGTFLWSVYRFVSRAFRSRT